MAAARPTLNTSPPSWWAGSVARDGPSRRSVLLGYAGWGPGQLDGEIQEGAWVPVDLDDALVYDLPYEERWSAGLSALGIDPARMIGLIADA